MYEGGMINCLEMVCLFLLILKKEGDKFFLVIFVEKVGIIVEDVFFVVVDLDVFDSDGV